MKRMDRFRLRGGVPQRVTVKGAGSSEADGLYERDGEYQGAARYIHEDGQLCVTPRLK